MGNIKKRESCRDTYSVLNCLVLQVWYRQHPYFKTKASPVVFPRGPSLSLRDGPTNKGTERVSAQGLQCRVFGCDCPSRYPSTRRSPVSYQVDSNLSSPVPFYKPVLFTFLVKVNSGKTLWNHFCKGPTV